MGPEPPAQEVQFLGFDLCLEARVGLHIQHHCRSAFQERLEHSFELPRAPPWPEPALLSEKLVEQLVNEFHNQAKETGWKPQPLASPPPLGPLACLLPPILAFLTLLLRCGVAITLNFFLLIQTLESLPRPQLARAID